MTAKDFRISFPYGATTAPYSPTRPHRGNDRACPTGTPIVIGSTTIGLTGSTGLATGPHLHTQAAPDFSVQNTVNPSPYEFKGGVVSGVRNTDTGDWGKYVKLKVGSMYVVYAHLSRVDVAVGQVIKGDIVEPTDYRVNKGDVINMHRELYGKDPSAELLKFMVGMPWNKAFYRLIKYPEYQTRKTMIQSALAGAGALKDKIINFVKGA